MRSAISSILIVFLIGGIFFLIISVFGYFEIANEREDLKNGNLPHLTYDENLAYRLKPELEANWSLFSKDPADTIKSLTTDSLQRRWTPVGKQTVAHAIFFGCSYTFGDGLADKETLPAKLSQLDSSLHSYNYALGGFGIQQAYQLLENGIQTEIVEDTGVAFYVFIDHHINRMKYDWFILNWAYDFPLYKLNKSDELIYAGTHYESRKLRTCFWKGMWEMNFSRLISGIHYIKRFLHSLGGNSEEFSQQDYKLAAVMLAEINRLYKQQFPGGTFQVVLYPGNNLPLDAYLRQLNVPYLDLRNSINLTEIDGVLSDGYHPNERGNSRVAEAIYKAP